MIHKRDLPPNERTNERTNEQTNERKNERTNELGTNKDRETQRDRDTDRQRDKKTERQRYRETDRKRKGKQGEEEGVVNMIHTTKTCETLLKPILKLSIPNKKLKI